MSEVYQILQDLNEYTQMIEYEMLLCYNFAITNNTIRFFSTSLLFLLTLYKYHTIAFQGHGNTF